jgi:hypothetical protein
MHVSNDDGSGMGRASGSGVNRGGAGYIARGAQLQGIANNRVAKHTGLLGPYDPILEDLHALAASERPFKRHHAEQPYGGCPIEAQLGAEDNAYAYTDYSTSPGRHGHIALQQHTMEPQQRARLVAGDV